MDEPPNQFDRIADVWEEVVADMEATAAEYRERGWDVLEVHPGDVTALDGSGPSGRWGLDVLAPGNEFSEVQQLVEDGGDFDGCEVFKAQRGDVVYLVVAMVDEAGERAVVFPAYYDPAHPQAQGMLDRARNAGEMQTHLRPLSDHAVVTFAQGDPDLFAPDE